MKTFTVTARVTVSCWTEVHAASLDDAIALAKKRGLADIQIDGSYPVDECFHVDVDGEPYDYSAEAKP